MAIYTGGKKCKLPINGVSHNIDIPTSVPISNGIMLLTSDGFMLRDRNNLRTTSTDVDEYENKLLSSDGIILKDKNDRYITSEYKNKLLSFDNYTLKDLNEKYLTTKGE